MKFKVADVPMDAERFLPQSEEDNSGVGVNFVDTYLKALKTTLEDGRKVVARRRGLKVILKVGDRRGEGLLRRLEHGPDVTNILDHALGDAANAAGLDLTTENGSIYLRDES